MKNKPLSAKKKQVLVSLGENLKLARLRRKLSTTMAAERANISRTTLWNLERGDANVSLETLMHVLAVYGLQDDLFLLAKDDLLGRKLQDIKLLNK